MIDNRFNEFQTKINELIVKESQVKINKLLESNELAESVDLFEGHYLNNVFRCLNIAVKEWSFHWCALVSRGCESMQLDGELGDGPISHEKKLLLKQSMILVRDFVFCLQDIFGEENIKDFLIFLIEKMEQYNAQHQ